MPKSDGHKNGEPTQETRLGYVSGNLNALTGLRFFAALSVVIYHFARPALMAAPTPILQLAGSGYAAVSFFFLLSGFILSYSYLSVRGEMRGTRRDFYVARLGRIYPAYLLAFLIALPFNVNQSLHANHMPLALVKLTVNGSAVLTMLQSWLPWTAWAWNYPAWSVSVEAFFYLTFPWIAPKLAQLRLSSCVKFCGALWLLSIFPPALMVLSKGVTGAPQLGSYLQMFVEFNPLLRWPEFLMGILLGRIFKLGGVSRIPGVTLSYLLTAGVLLALAFCPMLPHPLIANGLLAPLFGAMILSFAQAQGKGILSRTLSLSWLVVLGEASYGIYILQVPVSYLVGWSTPYSSLRLFAIYLAVLLVCSLLSWRFVEAPLRKALKHWLTQASKTSDFLVEQTGAIWAGKEAASIGPLESK